LTPPNARAGFAGVMEHKPQRNERGQPVAGRGLVAAAASAENLDVRPLRHCRAARPRPPRCRVVRRQFRGSRGGLWTYHNFGPFSTPSEYRAWLDAACANPDRLYHAIGDNAQGQAVGVAVYQNWVSAMGTIEIGGLVFSPRLQRRPAATEAMYLMMRRIFDELGYRHYEWRCDSLNLPSRAAAVRFGFQSEGLFRQAMITRGRNRDTVWFSAIDRDWPALRAAFESWLDPGNFAADGSQRRRLADLRSGAG
jgi:RimJ/RimL family protein N-acetyltransferase